jgi:hypothetical protein
MKKCCPLFLLVFAHQFSFAQHISAADNKYLLQKEDSMKTYAYGIILDNKLSERIKADSMFTKMLMRALKTPYSFNYPFDSLQTISILYPPDSSFRILTWQLMVDDNLVRQHGAIQMRTPDGSLRRFPLIDKSDVTIHIADTVGNNLGWIGAVYYKIIQKTYLDHKYYTLLGFDQNNIRSDKKIIEVLSFSNNEPVFGGRYFSFPDDKLTGSSISRYVMEYKKDASPRLNYDPEQDLIVFEHLVPESGQLDKKWSYIGDGDYEGFKWFNGKWVHVDKVNQLNIPEGKVPVPIPLNSTVNLLDDKTNDNDEEKPATDTKPKTKTVTPKKKKDDG